MAILIFEFFSYSVILIPAAIPHMPPTQLSSYRRYLSLLLLLSYPHTDSFSSLLQLFTFGLSSNWQFSNPGSRLRKNRWAQAGIPYRGSPTRFSLKPSGFHQLVPSGPLSKGVETFSNFCFRFCHAWLFKWSPRGKSISQGWHILVSAFIWDHNPRRWN